METTLFDNVVVFKIEMGGCEEIYKTSIAQMNSYVRGYVSRATAVVVLGQRRVTSTLLGGRRVHRDIAMWE